MIVYVDDDAAAGGNGTLEKPLQTLPNGNYEDANVTVFIFSGNYPMPEKTLYMGKNTHVYGQGGGGSFDTVFGINPASVSGTLPPRPLLTGTKPVVSFTGTYVSHGEHRAPFTLWSAMNGTSSLKHLSINSTIAGCFAVSNAYYNNVTVDNVTMNCRSGILLDGSNNLTVTNSSITAQYYAFYGYNTGGDPPGSTVTFTNTPLTGGRIYIYGNPYDHYIFNSAVNVERIEATGVTVTAGNHTRVTFNGTVTANSSSNGPVVRVENATFTNTLNITATAPAQPALQVVTGGSMVATANNNVITATGTPAIQMSDVTIPAAGVKFQTVNTSGGYAGAQFENVGGTGSVVISAGSLGPCVYKTNAPNVVLPAGTVICP
jgi:hypothetical protein